MTMVVQFYSLHLLIYLFPYFPKVSLVDFVYFMFLICFKNVLVTLYTDHRSQELGPTRMDFVESGSPVE